MCVIVVKNGNGVFDDAEFTKCWERNKDGLGFIAIYDGNIIENQKGVMTLERALAVTRDYRYDPDIDLICHFRLQSVGSVCADLTHPFSFDRGGKQRFLFHNGTISDIVPEEGDSDTKCAANLLSLLSDDGADKLLGFFKSTSNSRFVTVVETDEGVKVTIYPNHESVTEQNLWFSNLRHRTEAQPIKTKKKK